MFISTAFAAESTGAEQGGLSSIIMLAVFAAIFYFLLIRPQSKRQKEHKTMLESLQKGDEVVTGGGILGKITKITDNFVVLNVGNSVELKFQKNAISATLPKGTIKAVNE